MLNRGRPILLNLGYVVENKILRILTQADLKNIEPLISYESSKKSPKISQFQRRNFGVAISLEGHISLLWNFIQTEYSVSAIYHKIFVE